MPDGTSPGSPVAGVLLVFSYLVVPALCSMMFFRSIGRRLFAGGGFGILASAGGLFASAVWDLPSGASVVAAFGALFVGCSATYAISAMLRPTRKPEL